MCADYVTWRRIVETSEASRIVVYAEDEKTAVGVLAVSDRDKVRSWPARRARAASALGIRLEPARPRVAQAPPRVAFHKQ
jgi:hypothetical protein